jgi:hypothetical protein
MAVAAFLVALQGWIEQPEPRAPTRGYENKVNRLAECRISVKDKSGQPAVHGQERKTIGDVQLKIIWTEPNRYDWNYCLPELHGGKELLNTEYPSIPVFFEKKLRAKTILEVSVPDTPYAFYIVDGKISPFFWDSEKAVVWHLSNAALERQFDFMSSISVSSKTIKFTAPGGDMASFLVVDFSERLNSPKVKYYERFDGP